MESLFLFIVASSISEVNYNVCRLNKPVNKHKTNEEITMSTTEDNLVPMINAVQFELDVEGGTGVTLVDFYADWCGPCKMIAPVLEQLAEEYEGQLKIVKINADEEADVLAKYAVRGLPTMMVFKDGQSVDVTVGAQPYPAIKAMLEKHL
jgi:thioredoxin 1